MRLSWSLSAINNVVAETRSWSKRIQDMYTEGASDAEVAADLGITLKEFYNQYNNHDALRQLVDFGRTLSQAHWEGLARKNIQNKTFNSSLYAFYMKNKFAWADKTETVNSNENLNTNLDELRLSVSKEVEKFVRRYTPELTDAQRVISDIAKGHDGTEV